MLLPLLKSLRPHQWIKNAFVLAPLVFGHKLTEPDLLVRGLAAALIFSLLSGSVYLLNDLADIDKDRAHPLKRNRPIPSGALPVSVAQNASRIIAFAALTGAASLDLRFGLVAGLYWLLNVAYSRGLKHTAFVDVGIIALGFLFRILAGVAGRGTMPNSGWTIVNGFLAVIIAVMVLADLPSSAAWAIGLLVGIQLLFDGIMMISAGMAAKKLFESGTA
jgi:4-hydroxybenzoate polyprenyltransferase